MARETSVNTEKKTDQAGRDVHHEKQSTGGTHEQERTIRTTREGEQAGRGVARRSDANRSGAERWRTGGWDGGAPFSIVQRMAEDMDRLMEQFGFGRTALRSGIGGSLMPDLGFGGMLEGAWTPQVEVRQRGDRVIVRADLPGVRRDDVHVDVENDLLVIRGERRDEHEDEQDGVYRSERMYGQFYRTIPLPDGIDPDACEASYQDGVLEVTIPVPERKDRQGRRIQIR